VAACSDIHSDGARMLSDSATLIKKHYDAAIYVRM